MRRTWLPIAVAAATLSGCDSGPQERRDVASTRAVMRPDVAVPEGSVPRGAAARAGALAPPGPAVTPALLARGRDSYGAFCTPCHGSRGAGDGSVVARGFPAPPPFTDSRYDGLKSARTVEVITQGFGLMHPMADRLEPADRWAVAHHVQGLRGQR